MQNALEELFGPTLHLNASTLEVSFKTAFQRLHTTFYRSKLTSWMAAQEEDYRYIHTPLLNLPAQSLSACKHPQNNILTLYGLDNEIAQTFLKLEVCLIRFSVTQCLIVLLLRYTVFKVLNVFFRSTPFAVLSTNDQV